MLIGTATQIIPKKKEPGQRFKTPENILILSLRKEYMWINELFWNHRSKLCLNYSICSLSSKFIWAKRTTQTYHHHHQALLKPLTKDCINNSSHLLIPYILAPLCKYFMCIILLISIPLYKVFLYPFANEENETQLRYLCLLTQPGSSKASIQTQVWLQSFITVYG